MPLPALDDVLVTVGLVLILEGLLPAFSPALWRRVIGFVANLMYSGRLLRLVGLFGIIIGVLFIYQAQSLSADTVILTLSTGDALAAIGLVMILESLFPLLSIIHYQRAVNFVARKMHQRSPRPAGLVAILLGVAIIYLIRG